MQKEWRRTRWRLGLCVAAAACAVHFGGAAAATAAATLTAAATPTAAAEATARSPQVSSNNSQSISFSAVVLSNDVGTSATLLPTVDSEGVELANLSTAAAETAAPLEFQQDSWSVNLTVQLSDQRSNSGRGGGGQNHLGGAAAAAAAADGLNLLLSPAACNFSGPAGTPNKTSASFAWNCPVDDTTLTRGTAGVLGELPLSFTVTARYELKPGATFVAKTLLVHSSRPWSANRGGIFTVNTVAPWGPAMRVALADPAATTTASPSVLVPSNPYNTDLPLGLFARWPDRASGFFLATTNPWATFQAIPALPAGECLNGTDMPNFDLFMKTAPSQSECFDLCNSTSGAVGWVWDACDQLCWCKAHNGPMVAKTCRCFGQIATTPTGAAAAQNALTVSSQYNGPIVHYATSTFGEDHISNTAIVGLTSLAAYSSPDGINAGEMKAFKACVKAFLLDTDSRKNSTVKVNVAWDESDFQIDVGTPEGVIEYKRIFDRNSQLGVTHQVYEPRNTLHASRFNSTDGWGWEASLWFSMGEDIREGSWAPQSDPVPSDILEMIAYANTKGVKLLAYVYPCLAFEPQSQAVINGALDLSASGVKEWVYDTLAAFMRATGAGGFAWDHDIFAGPGDLHYAQWYAWMGILAKLRADFPDIVMDHRQTAHMWGPWYQLAGSYTEPLAGDENPETFGVAIPSLHTDHVSADQLRIVNWIYSMQQLHPVERIPGFMFHQTERSADNGDNPCFGNSKVCYDNNTRDADLLGYRYSVISNLGTAPLNNVLCMIPARDEEEFLLFPAEDVAFIRKWLQFGDDHSRDGILTNVAPILTLPKPSVNSVDGTAAFAQDSSRGFIFLFNPSMVPRTVQLAMDESIHLPNSTSASSDTWEVSEIYPRNYSLDTWTRGQKVSVEVEAGSARVLSLSILSENAWPHAHGMPGTVTSLDNNGKTSIFWTNAQAVPGMQATAKLWLSNQEELTATHFDTVAINGVPCQTSPTLAVLPHRPMHLHVHFKGETVRKLMPLGTLPAPTNTGGTFETNFSVPQAVKQQLEARAAAYPISWQSAEYNATWLVPTRLLASIYIASPVDDWKLVAYVDGQEVNVSRSYNSRGLPRSKVFLGYYVDLGMFFQQDSDFGRNRTFRVELPILAEGNFAGVFHENLETEYTSVVDGCFVR